MPSGLKMRRIPTAAFLPGRQMRGLVIAIAILLASCRAGPRGPIHVLEVYVVAFVEDGSVGTAHRALDEAGIKWDYDPMSIGGLNGIKVASVDKEAALEVLTQLARREHLRIQVFDPKTQRYKFLDR